MADPIDMAKTEIMQFEAEKCEDIDDMRQFLNKYSGYYLDWKTYINQLVEQYGSLSTNKFAKRCGFSVNTVKKWCQGGDLPRSRKEFIKLGFGLNFSLDETNRLLQRYGKYQRLYAKDISDAICIFSIQNKLTFDEFELIKHEIGDSLAAQGVDNPNKDNISVYLNTDSIKSSLVGIRMKEELKEYMIANKYAFLNAYNRLIDFLDSYVKVNGADFIYENNSGSVNSFLAERIKQPKLVASFNDMISDLRCHKIIPDKTKLIALGLYLNMTLTDINIMLDMAGMAPLCAKDKLESVLIYALNNIVLNNPDLEFSNAYFLDRYTKDPLIQDSCRKIMQEHYKLKTNEADDNDSIVDYVRKQISNFDFENENELSQLLAV